MTSPDKLSTFYLYLEKNYERQLGNVLNHSERRQFLKSHYPLIT